MKTINMRVDEEMLELIDAAAAERGQNRTEYLLGLAEGHMDGSLIEMVEQEPQVPEGAASGPERNQYPSAPMDPEERQVWVNERNKAIMASPKVAHTMEFGKSKKDKAA